MRVSVIMTGGLAIEAIAGGAVLLAVVIRGRLRARKQAPPPLPRRTRTAPGVPGDGPRLSWPETRDWHAIVDGYGPDAPAWPGGEKTAP